jgi:hypothetical protein
MRVHSKKVDDLIKEHETVLKDKDLQFVKMESILKSELLEFK